MEYGKPKGRFMTETERLEIEITPEMKEAGMAVVFGYDRRFSDIQYLASEVYEAMERARRKAATAFASQ
jgi:hypothetical protein